MDFLGRARQRWMIAMGLLPSVALGWTGDGPSPGTGGYVVDTSNRNDVVSFWQHVYKASEDYGSHAVGSAAFVDDVERRVNFVRALCGVPADVQFNTGATVYILPTDTYRGNTTPILPPNTTKAAASLQAANMITATLQQTGSRLAVSHDPLPICPGWTTGAWNAASKGNLASGYYGPGVADAYFMEDAQGLSGGNTTAGHRRWLLNPKSTNYATGDYAGKTPAQAAVDPNDPAGYGIYPANCMYVFPKPGELDSSVPAKFVPYPNAGFFPAPLNSPYWSLSYPGATFSAGTTVQMRDANGTLLGGVTPVSIAPGYGDNAIVWQVPAAASTKVVAADTRFTVTVSNFTLPGSATLQTHTYTVTLINPEGLTDSLALTGPDSPIAQNSTPYTLTHPEYSEELEVGFFKAVPGPIFEGAEASSPSAILDRTASAPLLSSISQFYRSGTRAFRLTFANRYDPVIGGVKDQIFELEPDLVPTTGAAMSFYYKRGYMTPTSRMLVETSSDGGLTWTPQIAPIPGNETNGVDDGFTLVNVTLPTSGSLRIRFRLTYIGGTLYGYEDNTAIQTGIFIDDISVTNCSRLEEKSSIVLPDSVNSVAFNSTTVGQTLVKDETWWLRARVRMADRWFPYGTPKIVTIMGAFLPRGAAEPPVDGATYLFTPLDTPTSYTLEVAKPANTPTEGAETSPQPVTAEVGNYSWVNSAYVKNGSYAYRLGVSTSADTLDTITFNQSFEPTGSSNLTFYSQRRRMAANTSLDAEVSTDNGGTWTSIGSQAGAGITNNQMDSSMMARSYSLAAYAGKIVRIRFAFHNDNNTNVVIGNETTNAQKNTGVWIDDIVVTNVWTSVQQTSLPGTANSFRLDATTAGGPLVVGDSYRLRVREMAGVVPREWGDPLVVVPTATPATGYDAWVAYDYPTLQNVPFDFDSDGDGIPNGIEYAFWLDPLSRNSLSATSSLSMENEVLKITRPLPSARAGVIYGAEASGDLEIWSDAGVTVTLIDGQAVASIPVTDGSRFLRWKITKP